MPDISELTDNRVLAQEIEKLSAKFLIEDDNEAAREGQIAALALLSESARQSGRSELSVAAQSLVDELSSKGSGKNWSAIMSSGLSKLSEAVNAHAAAASQPAASFSIAQDPELINDFVVESREHLESIESQVLTLEQDAENLEAIHSIFRSFHTIKGLAGFMELPLIQEVAHEVETILDQCRNSERRVTPLLIDVVLESKDYLSRWIRHLEQSCTGPVPTEIADNTLVLKHVHSLASGDGGEPEAEPEATSPESLFESMLMPVMQPQAPASADDEPIKEAAKKTAGSGKQKAAARSVKVDTDKLDHLVDMVGEMVIAQSLVRHDPDLDSSRNPRIFKNLTQLARITDEVQKTAMAMRMVPIATLFQKMARLVRDLSRKCGKQVNFVTVGEDVELDRNIVEELADPLMHMVRNSVDHGIESPEERKAAGKDPMARVELRAKHRSGYIVIEVVDDGKGINREKVLAKARSKGLVAPTATPPDAEVFNLIFAPGFSTAEQVSDVSGRGVGMDVVKKQIQKLRGSIDIASTQGVGTTFGLKLPLTLAIIDGLVVIVGAERFIIPLASIKELLRPTEGMVTTVENRAEVISIRERLLPVMRLYQRFSIEPRSTDPTECVFVVVEHEGRTFCLLVDELVGKQEVVIKSLGRAFQKVSGIAGGAILGDGNVALILDVQGVYDEGQVDA